MSNEKKQSALAAMLSQYEKSTSNSSDNAFDTANYFTTFLPDGIDNAMKRIRILPNKDGGSPFKEVEVHSQKVDNKNRKFTCISHLNDEACPFCEIREELLSTGTKEDEELAKSYKSRKMYVVRVIDRELEGDGPKFWRFPINYKKEGILDKIMATIGMLKEDITDVEVGRDIALNVVRVKNPRGGSYPAVNSVQSFDKEPLSKDAELAEKWLNDVKTWKDVYSIKPYDYLKLVVMGKIPMYDKKLEKFVAKEDLTQVDSEDTSKDLDSQISIGASSKSKAKVQTDDVTETYTAEVDVEEEVEDDLPF